MSGLASWVTARTAVVRAADGSVDAAAARESLRDLGALYAMAVDAHDVAALQLMFSADAALHRDGEVATGRDEILALLQASMAGFRRMLHTPETMVVHVAGETGAGLATAHAELVTGRGVIVAAHEYEDAFGIVDDGPDGARTDERWVFTSRRIRFVYAARADQYGEVLRHEDRVRLPGEAPRAMRGSWLSGA